jgi:hypothetical protein
MIYCIINSFQHFFHCEMFQLLVGIIIDVFFIGTDDQLIMIFESKKEIWYTYVN